MGLVDFKSLEKRVLYSLLPGNVGKSSKENFKLSRNTLQNKLEIHEYNHNSWKTLWLTPSLSVGIWWDHSAGCLNYNFELQEVDKRI